MRWTFAGLAVLCSLSLATGCRSQQSHAEDSPHLSVIPDSPQLFAQSSGDASYIYLAESGSVPHRMDKRNAGWETQPVLSKNGKLVAYSFSSSEQGRSEVWVCQSDGTQAQQVSGPDEDALLPAFVGDKTLIYVISAHTGHYSPIARPRRHEFDLMRVTLDVPDANLVRREQLTHQGFFDLISLSISPDGERALVSTSAYPIGSVFEEIDLAKPLAIKKIFQPHVPGEPQLQPAFGSAAFANDGMDIVFTAATDSKGGNYDYNVYQMSDVTGGELKALALHTGMLDALSVMADGTILVSNQNEHYRVDREHHLLQKF